MKLQLQIENKINMQEAAAGTASAGAMLEEETKGRDEQMQLIADQFDVDVNTVQHPSNKALTIVSSIPILPDFKFRNDEYAQGIFDGDPTPLTSSNTNRKQQRDYISQSLLIDNDNFASMFWPTEHTYNERKRRRDGDDDIKPGDKYEFKKLRE